MRHRKTTRAETPIERIYRQETSAQTHTPLENGEGKMPCTQCVMRRNGAALKSYRLV
jgi:hypothetical protein